VIRFGEQNGRIALRAERAGIAMELELTLAEGAGKHARLNGAALRTAEQLRSHADVLVFTPDRLVVVKGPPAVRRAYVDRALGRLFPGRAALAAEYGAAVAQRNAALRRVGAGFSSRSALEPWTDRLVAIGSELVAARREFARLLAPLFSERAGELGLVDARLAYDGEAPSREDLDERLERDLERGVTGAGPHLHDVALTAGSRELRVFGSQGEQRIAVLALLLAEADLLVERRGVPPLFLLDDVLSELDGRRRRVLAERISERGQALVTTTTRSALPTEPAVLVEVAPGVARRAA
jgi:DNA replication and repair protein RecF